MEYQPQIWFINVGLTPQVFLTECKAVMREKSTDAGERFFPIQEVIATFTQKQTVESLFVPTTISGFLMNDGHSY